MTKTNSASKKTVYTIGFAALLAVSTITLAGCDLVDAAQHKANGHTRQFSYPDAAHGKHDNALPDWVPADATRIREVVRTTGNERILTMTADPAGLPSLCVAIPPGQAPKKLEDSLDHSTLKAAWWKPGTEKNATKACGDWSVTVDGRSIQAFTPESTAVSIEKQPTPYK